MTRNARKLPTGFASETRFEVTPEPPAPFRCIREKELEQFGARLLRELLTEADSPELYAPLRRAANEALALAWATPFPLLVLPELLREKAGAARHYTRKQAALFKRCAPMLGQAA